MATGTESELVASLSAVEGWIGGSRGEGIDFLGLKEKKEKPDADSNSDCRRRRAPRGPNLTCADRLIPQGFRHRAGDAKESRRMNGGRVTTQKRECPCLEGDIYHQNFEERSLGVDRDFGEATVWRCRCRGRYWLEYQVEYEYLTAAGRWFRGLITSEAAASARAESAKQILEGLDWYFRGGSAFGGKVTKTVPGQLKYWLTPFPGPIK